MKVVNLSIPDEIWRQARIEAAKHSTSLSGLVRGYLTAMVKGKAPIILDGDSADEDRIQREALVEALSKSNLVLGYSPSRAETYER